MFCKPLQPGPDLAREAQIVSHFKGEQFLWRKINGCWQKSVVPPMQRTKVKFDEQRTWLEFLGIREQSAKSKNSSISSRASLQLVWNKSYNTSRTETNLRATKKKKIRVSVNFLSFRRRSWSKSERERVRGLCVSACVSKRERVVEEETE